MALAKRDGGVPKYALMNTLFGWPSRSRLRFTQPLVSVP
jgi:hypothetical protein